MNRKTEFIKAKAEYLRRKNLLDEMESFADEKDREICAEFGYSGVSWMLDNCPDIEKIWEEIQTYLDETGTQARINIARDNFNKSAHDFAVAAVNLMPDSLTEQRVILLDRISSDVGLCGKIIEPALALNIGTL